MGWERSRRRAVGWGLVAGLGVAGLAWAAPEPPGDLADAELLARPGPALRAALEATEAGDVARAESLLQELAARHPVIADYADLERIRLYTLAGRAEDALALGRGWPHAESPLRARVQREVGRVLAERGEEISARAAWSLALAATDKSPAKAELRFEIARSHRRSGQLEPAAEQLLLIWTAYPEIEIADRADEELAALEDLLGRSLRDAEQTRRRADAAFAARHNELALAGYERALELGLSGVQARRARRKRAETLFRLRRYPDAVEAYAALGGDPESRIAHARSLARSGHVPRAAELLETIADEVRGPRGAYARLVAALLWDDEGSVARAHRLFEELAKGSGSTARSALWRLGWEAYRAGRLEEARSLLAQLEERETDAISRLRPRYWSARAAERLGDPEAAERFGEMAREFPFSYYGWRAADRASAGASERPARTLEPGSATLTSADLERPRILLEAGLDGPARDELDRLSHGVRGLADRLALASLFADAGDHHRPQRLVVAPYQETLARGPGSGPLELWWHAWPMPWPEAAREATAGREGLHPELVYAIMREESGYRPEVLSVSGARGLLQLMPDTAQRVAEREALTGFDPDQLFDPEVNIRLGAAYLGELLAEFPGRAPSAAIASYNAGPHRIVRWLDREPLEDDEWVEAIPYEQTRHYVMRVLRSVQAYRVLY